LTQDELVARLHELGYADVTTRRIASWRANDLLPQFDIIGGGRGRCRGRESSAWSDGAEVLNQAIQVYELLKMYKSFDDLYLPLWMLGYPVPLWRVREALSYPLDSTVHAIEVELSDRDDLGLEDVIDDVAADFSRDLERTNLKLFQVPQVSLAAFTNIIMNGDYNTNDAPFEDGVEALERWDQETGQKLAQIVGTENLTITPANKPLDTIWTVFTHAPFINRHFSLQRLKEAVDECTDEDLMAVWRDLSFVREIVLLVKRLVMLLKPYIPAEWQLQPEKDFSTVLRAGKLLVWLDLSLRRSGYGPVIDHALPLVSGECQQRFNEDEIRQELAVFGPQITTAIEEMINLLVCLPQQADES
jgi:hypothetical protein